MNTESNEPKMRRKTRKEEQGEKTVWKSASVVTRKQINQSKSLENFECLQKVLEKRQQKLKENFKSKKEMKKK